MLERDLSLDLIYSILHQISDAILSGSPKHTPRQVLSRFPSVLEMLHEQKCLFITFQYKVPTDLLWGERKSRLAAKCFYPVLGPGIVLCLLSSSYNLQDHWEAHAGLRPHHFDNPARDERYCF